MGSGPVSQTCSERGVAEGLEKEVQGEAPAEGLVVDSPQDEGCLPNFHYFLFPQDWGPGG